MVASHHRTSRPIHVGVGEERVVSAVSVERRPADRQQPVDELRGEGVVVGSAAGVDAIQWIAVGHQDVRLVHPDAVMRIQDRVGVVPVACRGVESSVNDETPIVSNTAFVKSSPMAAPVGANELFKNALSVAYDGRPGRPSSSTSPRHRNHGHSGYGPRRGR